MLHEIRLTSKFGTALPTLVAVLLHIGMHLGHVAFQTGTGRKSYTAEIAQTLQICLLLRTSRCRQHRRADFTAGRIGLVFGADVLNEHVTASEGCIALDTNVIFLSCVQGHVSLETVTLGKPLATRVARKLPVADMSLSMLLQTIIVRKGRIANRTRVCLIGTASPHVRSQLPTFGKLSIALIAFIVLFDGIATSDICSPRNVLLLVRRCPTATLLDFSRTIGSDGIASFTFFLRFLCFNTKQ